MIGNDRISRSIIGYYPSVSPVGHGKVMRISGSIAYLRAKFEFRNHSYRPPPLAPLNRNTAHFWDINLKRGRRSERGKNKINCSIKNRRKYEKLYVNSN
jgi:hypothetical protein